MNEAEPQCERFKSSEKTEEDYYTEYDENLTERVATTTTNMKKELPAAAMAVLEAVEQRLEKVSKDGWELWSNG